MTMREVRCPSCGAPMAAQAFTGAHFTCRFCGAGIVVAPAVATAAAITIDRVGQPMIEVIKQVRRFSGLGLAEVQHALTRLPATFSVREASPADAMTALSALGCVGRIVTEAVHLPADPAFVAHDGAWGVRIEVPGDAKIEAIKLVREVSGLGLAEAKAALETPRALIPIEARSSHEEIRRRFAALGYVVSFAPSGG